MWALAFFPSGNSPRRTSRLLVFPRAAPRPGRVGRPAPPRRARSAGEPPSPRARAGDNTPRLGALAAVRDGRVPRGDPGPVSGDAVALSGSTQLSSGFVLPGALHGADHAADPKPQGAGLGHCVPDDLGDGGDADGSHRPRTHRVWCTRVPQVQGGHAPWGGGCLPQRDSSLLHCSRCGCFDLPSVQYFALPGGEGAIRPLHPSIWPGPGLPDWAGSHGPASALSEAGHLLPLHLSSCSGGAELPGPVLYTRLPASRPRPGHGADHPGLGSAEHPDVGVGSAAIWEEDVSPRDLSPAPRSMLPDVVDDFQLQHQHGPGLETIFYSSYVFFTKLSGAGALGISTLSLDFAGYESGACRQSEQVVVTLKVLIGAVPTSMILIGLCILMVGPTPKVPSRANSRSLGRRTSYTLA
ncbi:sphingosine-1-phosphate transporter MFSD2B isoform 4-T4 [Dama dama]|uniref:sphingosine-1-phosphate transporter MFSD2B isoform X3 n=1 Tax=Dama dama TaxID=30532 RepID=UPI002A362D72|nr:sphingosine-1-phosphate transporter MFSD2B isoform X3 [Dama dama]